MFATPEYFLEKFMHHLLASDSRPCRNLFEQTARDGHDLQWLLAEILWPAAQGIQQLRQNGGISSRIFNQALRTISGLAAPLARRHSNAPLSTPNPATDRSLFIVSAPGEPSDAGAHLLTILAESHGFSVFFAGAHVSPGEITFALGQLEPDAILIHGTLPSSLAPTQLLLAQLKEAKFWPEIQSAVTGSMVAAPPAGADLCAAHPVEILELLALCPDHRARPLKTKAAPPSLEMPQYGDIFSENEVRDLLNSYFPPRGMQQR